MTHIYIQHDFKPVGQGLFAYGSVEFRATPKGQRNINYSGTPPHSIFSWVYDCGTSSGQALVDRGIRDIAATLYSKLDLVVISHLHSDHISGLLRLLNDVETRTIMFPWAPLWQRLLIGFEQGLEANDAVMAFYVDPAGYLAGEAGERFEQVVFVLPSTGSAPDPDNPFPSKDPDDLGSRDDRKRPSETESQGRIAAKLEVPNTLENQQFAVALAPKERLVTGGAWEFVPYNDPKSAPKSTDTFKNIVKKLSAVLLGPNTEDRSRALASVKELYRSEFPAGLQNDLSLNLYTGPVPLGAYVPEPKADGAKVRLADSRLPILYTGDGNYSTKAHRERLARYLLEKRVNAVATFQVPHHGSKHNWSRGLAARVAPLHSVFCSDPDGRYGQPDPEVLHEFHPYGPIKVDKHKGSRWREHLWPNEASLSKL